MELEGPMRPWPNEPRRRLHSRLLLVALVPIVVAAAVVAGLRLIGSHSRGIGSGVVVIETNLGYQGAQAAGTGMVLTPSGRVLTNNHVIRGATQIRLRVPGTNRSYSARVVGYDVPDDVAILQASGASNLTTVSVGSSSGLQVGQSVQALGNAGGTGRLTPAPGTVTGLGRGITVSDDQGGSESLHGMIETDAAVRPGDSGGPLLDSGGHVIGMDTAASEGNAAGVSSANQGFAIPIDRALSIAGQITRGEQSASVHVGGTAFLGVEAGEASYQGSGAVVASVVPGSPADAAGFAPGDLITSVGGHAISSPDDLSAVVATQKPGASVSAVILDQSGNAYTTNLKLASGPPR